MPKITPAVWNAVRLAVERHPGLLTPEGSVLTAGGTHLQTALRAKLLVPLQRPEVPGAPRGMVRREAGPTLWRLTPEAQVGLDKFLEGGAKVGGKRPQLTDTNVFALQELIARHQHTEEGGDFLESGVSARNIGSSPHVRRLLEFGALDLFISGAGQSRVRVTPLGRELARARFRVFPPPPYGQEREDAERRARLPSGRITYMLEKLGLDEAELDAIRERRLPADGPRGPRLIREYQALLDSTVKPSPAGHSSGRYDGLSDKARKALAGYRPTSLHDRIAETLGWSVEETRSFSLQSLRELVRAKNPKLAREISLTLGDTLIDEPRSLHQIKKGRSVGTALLVGGAIVGGLLLLRPLFRDAFEQHKWNMEHDAAYRASHQAMEISDAAQNVVNTFGSSGGQALDRADVVHILGKHFRTHTRYRKWPSEARNWFFQLAVDLMDHGVDAPSALALSHGLAHNLRALQDFSYHLKTGKPSRVWYLRVPVRSVSQAILRGSLKVSRRPIFSVPSEKWVRGATT